MTKRTTTELATLLVVKRTYCPVPASFTARRPDDSPAMLLNTSGSSTARLGPSTVPLVTPSSASYSRYGTVAPLAAPPEPPADPDEEDDALPCAVEEEDAPPCADEEEDDDAPPCADDDEDDAPPDARPPVPVSPSLVPPEQAIITMADPTNPNRRDLIGLRSYHRKLDDLPTFCAT